MHEILRGIGLLLATLWAPPLLAQAQLDVVPAEQAPVIDGKADDAAWASAPVLTVHDALADIDIRLQSVRVDDSIYMLASFPDETENRQHRTLHWHAVNGRYEVGPEREDTLVLKWNMMPAPADLSLSASQPYKADIWYWKSARTDHAGYADDKYQVYSRKRYKRARLLISKDGQRFFLYRQGDSGEAAYRQSLHTVYAGDTLPRYEWVMPQGSRANVRAKGAWSQGRWTVEFQRALNTGHADDVQFSPDSEYWFGVSRYEVAGRQPDPLIEQPYFGSGEIGELIRLYFRPD